MLASLMSARRFAPLVLVPVPQRLQRQLHQEHVDRAGPFRDRRDRADGERRQPRDPRHGDAGDAAAVPLGPRRPARRPLRQGSGRTANQARGDRRGARRGRRHRPPFRAAPDELRPRARRHGGVLQPDQIRHPARSPGARGAAGRQRADRGRNLPFHPARHHRRRLRAGLRRRTRRRRPDGRHRASGAGRRAVFIPKTGEAAPGLRVDPNILRSTRDLLRRPRRRSAPDGRRDRSELVLAGRRGRPLAGPAAGQGRRCTATSTWRRCS